MDQFRLLQELDDRRKQPIRFDTHAGEPPDLTDQDRDGNAADEADQDRLRQKRRDDAEAELAADQAEDPDRERQRRSHGDALGPAHRSDRKGGGEHRHRRRIGTYDQLARGAEDRIAEKAKDARIDADLGRKPGDRRIGDGTRDGDGRDSETRHRVAAEPSGPIARKATKYAEPAEHSVPPDQRIDMLIPLKEAEASRPACIPLSLRTTPFEFCSCTTLAPPATAMLPETAV